VSLPQPLTFVCFNFHYYQGPNPYLNDSALVFDWGILGNPLPIEQYQASIAQFFPDYESMRGIMALVDPTSFAYNLTFAVLIILFTYL
jgi:preprotein translocase subunit SecY